MNQAITTSLAERLEDLGGISVSRICSEPPPGSAKVEDVSQARRKTGRLYELVDGTLVEKAMGWQEALIAGVLVQWLRNFLDKEDLGVVTGPDGLSRILTGTVRGPDVAFVSWTRLPEGLPNDPVPDLVPDFVIEVLSADNTRAEMARKRREYFHAGVRLVWMVDPRSRTVAVYTSSETVTVADEEYQLDGGQVLPGWNVDLRALFAHLDRKPPQD